jgi:hypothetical protein
MRTALLIHMMDAYILETGSISVYQYYLPLHTSFQNSKHLYSKYSTAHAKERGHFSLTAEIYCNLSHIIWLSNLSILSVPDEGYSRNVLCALNLISTIFYLSISYCVIYFVTIRSQYFDFSFGTSGNFLLGTGIEY